MRELLKQCIEEKPLKKTVHSDLKNISASQRLTQLMSIRNLEDPPLKKRSFFKPLRQHLRSKF